MKKIILPLFLLCILSAGAFGQTVLSTQNIKQYNSCFPENKQIQGRFNMAYKYYESICDGHYDKISAISGDITDIDTEEEFFLASYLCSDMVNSRAVQAAQMLPKNRDSDLKVGAFMYQNLQIATFLKGSNASVYATLLNEFCTENRINKAEIETYYRNGIRGLVSAVVDEEFNKVSFLLGNSNTFQIARSHNAVLIRNPQNGQYTLNYGGAYTNNETRTITANSLETIASEMGRRTSDFDQTGINAVRAQAALIPAVARPRELEITKTAVTNFFLTPNSNTYDAMISLYKTYLTQTYLRGSFLRTVEGLNPAIAMRMVDR